MTRRERMARRADQREMWAESAAKKSDQRFNAARAAVDGIPFGQPILVGHHSENRHRRALEKSDNAMRKGIELQDKAERHAFVAGTLRDRLESSIFSDDSDAVDQLEARIAENEAKRDRMKEVNRLYRKGDAAGLAAIGIDIEQLRAKLAAAGPYWGSRPHLPYELTNIGARIRSDRERIEQVQRQAKRQAEATANGGVLIQRFTDNNWCQVTFDEKPERAILDALKAAGYRWTSGTWCGYLDKLPAEVAALA